MTNTNRPHNTELYKIVHDKILEQIRTERLKRGDKIPSERNLCKEFGVSMITVRKALDILAEKRVIEKHHGSGNYVREIKRVKVAFLVSEDFDRPQLTEKMIRELNDTSNSFELIPYRLENLSAFGIKHFLTENEMPTVILTSSGINDMAKHDMLMPLERFKEFEEIIVDTPGSLDFRSMGHDGLVRHYSVPIFLNPTVFVVNTDLASKASLPTDRGPADWAEMLEWCKKFDHWAKSENNGCLSTYSFSDRLASSHLSYLMMSLGGSVMSDSLDELASPGIGSFVTLLSKMISDGYMTLLDHADAEEVEPFISGNYLFYMSALPEFVLKTEMYSTDFDFSVFPVPAKDSEEVPVSGVSSIRLCIAKMNAEEPFTREACWRAVRDLSLYAHLDGLASDMLVCPASVYSMRRQISRKKCCASFYECIPYYQLLPSSDLTNIKKSVFDSFLSLTLTKENALKIPLNQFLKAARRLSSAPALKSIF
ncbi:MAG: extracellular solute-binding protein [Lentisphaerae bacterium]|nr:extracellular solute-binding protein [Lentisphaerota bacterium]